jgi:hypothetical protein
MFSVVIYYYLPYCSRNRDLDTKEETEFKFGLRPDMWHPHKRESKRREVFSQPTTVFLPVESLLLLRVKKKESERTINIMGLLHSHCFRILDLLILDHSVGSSSGYLASKFSLNDTNPCVSSSSSPAPVCHPGTSSYDKNVVQSSWIVVRNVESSSLMRCSFCNSHIFL